MLIAITGKRRIDQHQVAQLRRFISELLLQVPELKLLVHPRYCETLMQAAPGLCCGAEAESPEGADLVLSIGGDGTFLRAARWVEALEIPILGINSGHLGYMADVSLEHSSEVIKDIVAGNFTISRRTLLQTDVFDPESGSIEPFTQHPYALNEVAVLRDDTSSMISIWASLDSKPLACYRADGLIVSTPTGSTGYNLSVGGPIMAPEAATWSVAPVAAHTLTMRPLVVPDTSVITLLVESRAPNYRVSLDSRSGTLPQHLGLRISRAPFMTKIAHRQCSNFAETLQQKLLWGLDAR